MDLASYFVDDDNDVMTMSAASYSFNAGKSISIPAGIFTKPSQFVINASPSFPSQVGVYTITVTVTDTALPFTTSFIYELINRPPRFVATLPDQSVPLNSIGSYDL